MIKIKRVSLELVMIKVKRF